MYTANDERVVMQVNGLKAAFHMPNALIPKFKNKNGGNWHLSQGEENKAEEIVQNLPPGNPRFVFPVDEYHCPANWMNGSVKASSYWLPVRAGCGMWLDFNYNYLHSHHVACVVSIQGINPITGQKTKNLHIEQYREKCPIHKTEFGQDRYCEKCEYKWAAQNYVSSNCTPKGLLWIDGFKFADGIVRQYVFTKETVKGVANQIIGDERVFAVGIAFYLSKEPKKVEPLAPELTDANYSSGSINYSSGSILKGFTPSNKINPSIKVDNSYKSHGQNLNCSVPKIKRAVSQHQNSIRLRDTNDFVDALHQQKLETMSQNPQLLGIQDSCTDFDYGEIAKGGTVRDENIDIAPNEKLSPSDIDGEIREKSPEEIEKEMEKLEITAGARIRQQIYLDPESPEFWRDEPEGLIYLNYCSIEDAEKIMKNGRKERAGSFMSALSGI
jgi:hypothetical protein